MSPLPSLPLPSPPPAYFTSDKPSSLPPNSGPLVPSYTTPYTPPPAYLSRGTYAHRLSAQSQPQPVDLLEATVQDVRANYFVPEVAKYTMKMSLDEIYAITDVASQRHGLTLEEALEARERVRKEWCDQVGKRMKKKRQAWMVGGVLLTALGVSLSATLIKQ